MKHARNPRRALIVVSDGGDNNSRYTLREFSALAFEVDAQIFSICLYQNPRTAEEAEGLAFWRNRPNSLAESVTSPPAPTT